MFVVGSSAVLRGSACVCAEVHYVVDFTTQILLDACTSQAAYQFQVSMVMEPLFVIKRVSKLWWLVPYVWLKKPKSRN